MSDTESIADTRRKLATDRSRLRELWRKMKRTEALVRQGAAAYMESRSLLERIDGVPDSPVVSEIHIPD